MSVGKAVVAQACSMSAFERPAGKVAAWVNGGGVGMTSEQSTSELTSWPRTTSLDMAAAKAEAARLKREREEKEAKKMEWGKGLVQREEEEKRQKELAAMRSTAFARTADDRELNDELKAQDRWNDPAAAFLTVRT